MELFAVKHNILQNRESTAMNSIPRASRKKCCASNDVPCTNRQTGNVFWKSEPCQSDTMPGSRFCTYHDPEEPQQPAPLPAAPGAACPSCCSRNTEPERDDSVAGFVTHCKDCDWTWCADAAGEAKIMADVLYGWAMPKK